jgi:hypothetical protein
MSGESSGETISKDQLKRLCVNLLAEAPKILKGRDKSDPKMDRKSALLRALYLSIQEKLGVPKVEEPPATDFKTYDFAYRAAIYELVSRHAKEPFEYQPIINQFLGGALKKG